MPPSAIRPKSSSEVRILLRERGNRNRKDFMVTRQSKRRFVRVNASSGVYSDKGVYLAGSFGGRRCVNWHEKPCWRASAAPGSAFKEQGAARGGRFAEAVCQSKRLPPPGARFYDMPDAVKMGSRTSFRGCHQDSWSVEYNSERPGEDDEQQVATTWSLWCFNEGNLGLADDSHSMCCEASSFESPCESCRCI